MIIIKAVENITNFGGSVAAMNRALNLTEAFRILWTYVWKLPDFEMSDAIGHLRSQAEPLCVFHFSRILLIFV